MPGAVVMAGGKKLPELDALTMAYRAIEEGAAGVDMGRNIFQSHDPAAMIRAVSAVVHDPRSRRRPMTSSSGRPPRAHTSVPKPAQQTREVSRR